MLQNTIQIKTASNIAKAIGNQYRMQIINILLTGEKCVGDLNKVVAVSQPALSQHLSKLRREGIVGARREQRNIYYYITNPHIARIIGILLDMQTDVKESK